MMHANRVFSVSNVGTAEELADKLTNYSWCLCNGFRLGGLLFLNDATSEDGAGEFAVVEEATRRQVESITFSWCSKDEALKYINDLVGGEPGIDMGKISNRIENCSDHERCRFCA